MNKIDINQVSKVNITNTIIDAVRKDNEFLTENMTDQEIKNDVKRFFKEISSPEGLSIILENLDWFNY